MRSIEAGIGVFRATKPKHIKRALLQGEGICDSIDRVSVDLIEHAAKILKLYCPLKKAPGGSTKIMIAMQQLSARALNRV